MFLLMQFLNGSIRVGLVVFHCIILICFCSWHFRVLYLNNDGCYFRFKRRLKWYVFLDITFQPADWAIPCIEPFYETGRYRVLQNYFSGLDSLHHFKKMKRRIVQRPIYTLKNIVQTYISLASNLWKMNEITVVNIYKLFHRWWFCTRKDDRVGTVAKTLSF